MHSSNLEPSSKLKMPRPISKDNLKKFYLYYLSWKKGEKGISKEITAITVNSFYIMAAIDFIMDKYNE